jgi:hypothetical protein
MSPNAIADDMPEEGELDWSVNHEGALVATLVEISRKPLKLRQPSGDARRPAL